MQTNTSDINRSREREDRRKQALGLIEYLHVAAKAAGDKKLQEAYLAAFRALDSVRERTFEDLSVAPECICGHPQLAHEDDVGFCWDCDACAADPACRMFVERVLKDGADRLAERRKDAVLVRIRMGEVAAENLADACRRASYRAEDRMADAELSDEKRAQAEADYESLSWASRWLVAEEARCLEGVTDPGWEREHVEGWTRLLERAERCLSCDPDAGSSCVVAHAIRASIAAGTRKDDASRIRPTDGPPRLLVEIVTAGGVQVGDVLLLDGECCEVTDRGGRIGFTLWFGRTPEAFELDQPVVRVLDAAVMERGRPDDELEAALDGDNPEPPLRS